MMKNCILLSITFNAIITLILTADSDVLWVRVVCVVWLWLFWLSNFGRPLWRIWRAQA